MIVTLQIINIFILKNNMCLEIVNIAVLKFTLCRNCNMVREKNGAKYLNFLQVIVIMFYSLFGIINFCFMSKYLILIYFDLVFMSLCLFFPVREQNNARMNVNEKNKTMKN